MEKFEKLGHIALVFGVYFVSIFSYFSGLWLVAAVFFQSARRNFDILFFSFKMSASAAASAPTTTDAAGSTAGQSGPCICDHTYNEITQMKT